MISFENFKTEDGLPIYLQIIRYIKREIAAGNIKDGDEIPSRRLLAALLGVNPNTIQKAYKMLEDEGLIASHTGAKSVITLDESESEEIKGSLAEDGARAAVEALKQMGITKEEAKALLDKFWD